MKKAQKFVTIRSKVNAQKVRRRIWSVRGMGTMQGHFTVENRGCPREKYAYSGDECKHAFPGQSRRSRRPIDEPLPALRLQRFGFRSLLIEDNGFARAPKANFLDHARAIGCHLVHHLIGRVRCSTIHKLSCCGRHDILSVQE